MNGTKLTIPQIADEFKSRTHDSPVKVYLIDYGQLAEWSGWSKKEINDYEQDGKDFWTIVTDTAEALGVCVYFGYYRILAEVIDDEAWLA